MLLLFFLFSFLLLWFCCSCGCCCGSTDTCLPAIPQSCCASTDVCLPAIPLCVTLCLSEGHCDSKFQNTIVPIRMKVCQAAGAEVCLAAGEKNTSVLTATSVILSYTTNMMICLSIYLPMQHSVVEYFLLQFCM